MVDGELTEFGVVRYILNIQNSRSIENALCVDEIKLFELEDADLFEVNHLSSNKLPLHYYIEVVVFLALLNNISFLLKLDDFCCLSELLELVLIEAAEQRNLNKAIGTFLKIPMIDFEDRFCAFSFSCLKSSLCSTKN